MEELEHFKGRLMIAQGLNDKNVGEEQMYAVLRSFIRIEESPEVAVFPEADHQFSDAQDRYVLFKKATDFFLAAL